MRRRHQVVHESLTRDLKAFAGFGPPFVGTDKIFLILVEKGVSSMSMSFLGEHTRGALVFTLKAIGWALWFVRMRR